MNISFDSRSEAKSSVLFFKIVDEFGMHVVVLHPTKNLNYETQRLALSKSSPAFAKGDSALLASFRTSLFV